MRNGTKRYYSQGGEDELLWKLFKKQSRGFYIDVGAFDGIHLSNSYIFELGGWTGICIEAHPEYYQKCLGNRPNSICIHAACVGDNNIHELKFQSEDLGLLSGIDRMPEDEIIKRYAARGISFEGYKEVSVPATTLNNVLGSLENKPRIDFITIDVEGNEIDVLNGFDISVYKPKIILVEANTPQDELALDEYLNHFSYKKIKKIGVNIFYTNDIDLQNRVSHIKLNYKTKVSEHPRGMLYNYPSLPNKYSECKIISTMKRILRKIIR